MAWSSIRFGRTERAEIPPSDDVNAGTPPDTAVSDAGDPPDRAAGDGGASNSFPGDRPGMRSSALPSGDGALVEECKALVLYVARHGDILDDESAKSAVTELPQAIVECRAEPGDRGRRTLARSRWHNRAASLTFLRAIPRAAGRDRTPSGGARWHRGPKKGQLY